VTNPKKKRTKTSSFGSPGRISHDSSDFYDSKLYRDKPKRYEGPFLEQALPGNCVNRIFPKSSELMAELPDHSVHLMVTSPPYNVSKEYDQDLTLDAYRDLLRSVFQETFRVLVTGGRACINLANLGRKPYLPLHAYVIADLLEIGYLMRGEIIWNKAASASASTAWGTWRSPANPVLRDIHEYILVFSKDSFRRSGEGKESTLKKEAFLEYTKSVWTFPAVSARQIGHPAPFPEELPRRLIQLYTFKDDVVLDPFCGSGTTCLAAHKDGRRYVGYEVEAEYVQLAEARLRKNRKEMEP
jgi:site-specific DNA-methyltransferase (adenine-specific)